MSNTRPLFDAYPKLAAALDIMPLCSLPTPVHALHGFGERASIKRDDLTHPIYGGNKVRKLELIGADLRRRATRRVITFGGTGTNAGVATAFLCRELGIDCTVLTFDQPPSATVDKNQALMRRYGARLVHVGPIWTTALAFYLHPSRFSAGSYFLFAGCSNPVSIFGYVNAAFELRAQIAAGECPKPAEIVVAAGTAVTLSGLTLGCALAGLRTGVLGVRVAPARVGPIASCTASVVEQQMQWCRDQLARAHPEVMRVQLPAPVLLDDWYGGGYGITTPAADAAILALAKTGIPLEQTYSGKAFAASLARLRSASGPVLFWNTYDSHAAPAAPVPGSAPQ